MSQRRHKFHLLLHSADLVEDKLRLLLTSLGVGPRQARIIEALHRMGETSQATLAREFQVAAASMSTMTSRMIDAGLISRRTDPDDVRGNLLGLTEKGELMLVDIRAAWDEIDLFLVQAIGPEALEQLAEDTRTLRDALGGHRPGHPHKRKLESASGVRAKDISRGA